MFDIGVGPDDSVFMISTTNRLFRWNADKEKWDRITVLSGGLLAAVDVGLVRQTAKVVLRMVRELATK